MKTYKDHRREWIPQQIESQFSKEDKILDVGAGPQPYRNVCGSLGLEYEALDFGDYSNLDYKMDLTKPIDLLNETYDGILLTEVLEHIPNPVALLEDLVRILKIGGKLIITAPMKCDRHQEPYIYSTGYFPEFYEYWSEKFKCEATIEEHPRGVLTVWTKT